METSYHVQRATQQDNKSWAVHVHIMEGLTESLQEEKGTIARYRPSKIIRQFTYTYPPMTEAQMHEELKKELAADKTRTPIQEQTIA